MVEHVESLATLTAAGFDIAHTFDAAAAAREPGLAVLAGPARLGLLVGNTRALWPPFTAALKDRTLAADPDPLERYTERTIDAAFAPSRIYYSHRRHEGSYLPMQRLAVAAGLGALAPNHLVIHPVYGPWFALRAVILLDGAPPVRTPIARPCRCTATCDAAFERARRTGDARDWLIVRDSCTMQTWRYGDDQIRFHYTSLLRRPP